jgi:type VI secretion system protein ImpH
MATTSGQPSSDLARERMLQRLEQQPYRFGFFQAVRLLERLYPSRSAVGHFAAPRDETISFSAPPNLIYPPSEISTFGISPDGQDGAPSRLEVAFLGLNTVNGPMPRAQTASLLERAREGDRASNDFLDIFNHRLLSLFYRAWKRYRFFLVLEKRGTTVESESNVSARENMVSARLYDLVGLGTPGLLQRMAIPDEAAVFYSGLLSQQVRSATALQQILEDFFDVSVKVQQFTGVWEQLPVAQQTFLREGTSFAETLGAGAVVGTEVWNHQGMMTIRLGPLPLAKYRHFLPGAPGQHQLQDWLQFYSRGSVDFMVQLVLAREEVPQPGLLPRADGGLRLGYESWLKVKPLRRDPDETTYVCRR